MPLVVGTAGHIDHGKTALIRALTGQDTDRLKEERERGISIDLGFAWFDTADGRRVGIVDVPGHERFIRNMLAGAHGMDLVLFTVAADDGVMPQSEEHLDILHLLGVRRGIFVITKADLVDARRVEAVREEIEILALGSTLEGAPVVAVSAQTGTGMEALRETMGRVLRDEGPAPPGGCFRLPVDRAFVIKGRGVVVTGTAVSGSVRDGDSVRLQPAGLLARVRAVEAHGVPVAQGGCRQRLALNLSGLERTQVVRGMVVCDPALERVSARFDARVEVRPGRPPLATHRRVRVHVGTAEVLGRIVLLGGRERIEGGEAAWAQIVLREPVQVLRGDRFVLRDETARRTVGGGEVVHPFAKRHARREADVGNLLAELRSEDEGLAGRALLRASDQFATAPSEAAQALALDEARLLAALRARDDVVEIAAEGAPLAFTTADKVRQFEAALLSSVEEAHRRDPLAPGVEMETLRTSLPWDVPPRVFRWGLDALVRQGRLVRDERLVRAPEHRVALPPQRARLADRIEARLVEGALTPPDVGPLAAELGVPADEVRDVLRVLEHEGRVERLATDLYYHPGAVREGVARLQAHCREHGEITAADFRDLIGASRKYAIAFLDWCDRTGVTVRIGDVRRLRR